MNLFAGRNPLQSKVVCMLVLIILPSIVYFNSLHGAFQFDDRNLLTKKWISDLDSFDANVELSSIVTRPMLLWSFAANNHLDDKNTFGFHLVNLTLHILVTLLIFTVLIRIKKVISKGYISQYQANHKLVHKTTGTLFIPFSTTLIFALHPINTDAVTYISSRSSLLATFFYLLTIHFFVETLIPSRTVKNRLSLALLTILGTYLALASKLIAITLPVIILFLFLVHHVPKYFPDSAQYFRITTMLWFFGCGGIVLVTVAYLSNLLYLPKDQGFELYGGVPYLLVQFKVIIFYYLTKFVFPFNLNVDSGFPFTDFATDLGISFSIFIVVSIIISVLKWGNIWTKLGIIWFFLSLSPTSSIVPLNDLAVEHRMYLPMSLGLCLVTGWMLSCFKRNIQIFSLILIVLSFSMLTAQRNKVWINEITLWSDSIIKNPNSPRVHNNLGKAYYEAGQLKNARFHLETSVFSIPRYVKSQFNVDNLKSIVEEKRINSDKFQKNNLANNKEISIKADFAEPHYNLASVYLDLGQLDAAEFQYRAAIKLNPSYYEAEFGLGSVKNKKNEYGLAIEHFIKSIDLMREETGQSDYALGRLNLGEVYGKTQRYNKAIIELNRAIEADSSMFIAHYNLGTAYMLRDSLDKAENSLKDCLALKPNYEPALFNLARVYQKKHQWKKSNEILNKFVKAKGPNSYAYSEIAWNNLMSGNMEIAIEFYEKVLNYEPTHLVALINLAKINYRLGNHRISRSYVEQALKQDISKIQLDDLNELLKQLSNQ